MQWAARTVPFCKILVASHFPFLLNSVGTLAATDLCFDIIFIYKKAFGNPFVKERDEQWLINKTRLLDAELKSLTKDIPMNVKFRNRLSDRLVERSIEAGVQIELLQYLDEQVKNYASFKRSRQKGVQITNNLLFVVVRLMDDIYVSGK